MSVTKTFFLKVEVVGDSFKVFLVGEEFNYSEYIRIQIDRAVTCHLNRNAVRERYPELRDISDTELTEKHKSELLQVFRENKGTEWAKEHILPLCTKIVTTQLSAEIFNESPCIFFNLKQVCKKCSKCVIKEAIEKAKEKKG